MKTLLLLLIIGLLTACGQQSAEPLVVIATPDALDAGFRTYQHESGAFSLRIPPNWIPDELPDDNGIRMQFTAVEGNERVVRLSLTLVNTGQALTPEAFIQAVNAYQPPADVSAIPWEQVEAPAAMQDGSVRLTGYREYPTLGRRSLNIFLQGNGTYFSALEIDVTDIPQNILNTLWAVVNTYEVNPDAPLNAGEVTQIGATVGTGVVGFGSLSHWVDSDGGFNITGEVTNNSGRDLEAVRLTAFLFDSDGNALTERADVLVYDVFYAEETAPFRLRFDTGRPTTAVRYELHAAARQAEFSLTGYFGRDSFLIGEDQAVYNTNNNLTIQGVVQNNTDAVVGTIKITATIYNDSGAVVGTESTFINRDSLIPQEAAPFEVVFYHLGGDAFRYVLTAQGYAPQTP